ncbi:MAG: zinc-dependent alcohol dehydrogenase [Acidimicrobiales bacterium]
MAEERVEANESCDLMKVLRARGGSIQVEDAAPPAGEGVLIQVVSSSICGSDLHLLELGIAEGCVLGHEFAGYAPDGTAVAVEPSLGCFKCPPCLEGTRGHCVEGSQTMGVRTDGGMAQEVIVPAETLVRLPSGLDIKDGSLVEPIAVSLHAVNRAHIAAGERVLVVGAGAIGLAAVVVISSMGIVPDIAARHPHQQAAAERLGASLEVSDGYDVVIDAVGTTESMNEALELLRPMGRISMVGTPWEPIALDLAMLRREASITASYGYAGTGLDHEFTNAARIVAETRDLAEVMVTHRFPLDAGPEAFAAAGDRRAGAIKVVFDL